MQVKAIKLYENGFISHAFIMGGEEGEDEFYPSIRYRSSLQNFLIDTGDEVILVDTGMPREIPDAVPDENTKVYMGTRIRDYVSALADLGYRPEQVTKILVTHKHADHTGEVRSFPNAKVYIGLDDADCPELKGADVVRVQYKDGPFENFPAHEKIAEGVYFIKAKGHTNGNSIIVAHDGERYYMMHGDVTYSDEALYADKLSVVFEDKEAARDTLTRVRAFISSHPTVYCSTHTPLGYENLEALRIVDLNAPPKPIPPKDIVVKTVTGKYVCSVCGYVYDPEKGDPEHGVAPGTKFEDLPGDWHCPNCGQARSFFNRA